MLGRKEKKISVTDEWDGVRDHPVKNDLARHTQLSGSIAYVLELISVSDHMQAHVGFVGAQQSHSRNRPVKALFPLDPAHHDDIEPIYIAVAGASERRSRDPTFIEKVADYNSLVRQLGP